MANLVPRKDLFNFNDDFFSNLFPSISDDTRFDVDIIDNDKSYEVKADLPGFNKDQIQIEYDKDILSIRAAREDQMDEKDEKGNYIRRERSSRSFSRQFYIKDIDEDQIKATFKDGVLDLTLPKANENQKERKKIDIQ